MRGRFWLDDEAWAVIEPLLPKNQPGARRVDDPRDQRDHPRAALRLPLARLPARLRPTDHHLQPLPSLVPARDLAAAAGGVGGGRTDRREHRHRQRLHQGAPLGSGRKRGARAQAIGPSRGGRTTKLHLITDLLGRPIVLHLTPGNVADIKAAPTLLAAAGRFQRLLADRGYDADGLRRDLRAGGATPVIPGRRSRQRPVRYDAQRYRERWRIEATVCRLKDFRRVATRYDKLAVNFLSAVTLATLVAFYL
jgi:transposase